MKLCLNKDVNLQQITALQLTKLNIIYRNVHNEVYRYPKCKKINLEEIYHVNCPRHQNFKFKPNRVILLF